MSIAGNAAFAALANLSTTPAVALDERLMREGEPFSTYGNSAGSPVAVATGAQNLSVVSTTILPPMVGRVFYVESARYSIDQPAAAQFSIAPDAPNGRFAGLVDQQIVAANQVVTVPVRQCLRATEFQNGIASVNIRNNLTGGSVSYRGAVSLIGRLVTDDLNWGAAHPILVAGDSISAGTGPTKTAAMYHFLVRDWLNMQGFDCRLILKSKSGTNSTEHEAYRAAGWHRPTGRPRMGWYALGTNDAAQAVAPATFVANLTAYWTWWAALYPTAPLVVMAPPPLLTAGYEATAVTLRAAAGAYVTSVASPLLRFVDLGTGWSAADSSKTIDGIHPNDTAHAMLRDVIVAQFRAQAIVPG